MTHSKVHEIQLPHSDVLLSILSQITALHSNSEDDVGTRGMIVHIRHCKMSYEKEWGKLGGRGGGEGEERERRGRGEGGEWGVV